MARKKTVPQVLHYGKNNKLMSAVGAGVGRHFIEAYFPKAKQSIRIASAYFRLSGHKIAKDHIGKKVKISILVRKERGHAEAKHVQETIVKEIAQEIFSELEKCEIDLADAVIDLLERMHAGKFVIKEAREMNSPFHCKFYISDEKLFWHGSSNYSNHALTKQSEQISLIEDHEQVKKFINWYDTIIADANDLLEELRTLLQEWLDMSQPFDIYLKTLYLLFKDLFTKQLANGAHAPSYFQKGVVSHALNQIDDYSGAMIVAATGLGKTIIGAEVTSRLWANNKINRAVLIAPHIVHHNWERELQGRGFESYKIFNITVPFLKESTRSHCKINVLKAQLSRADRQTLIIIDEAHFYRNQLLNEKRKQTPSRVYELFQSAVEKGAKIILLTATAYSTDFQNVNSLLHLLPYKGLETDAKWKINSPEEFTKLPVVTILGIPHVLKMARERGDVENERVFIRLIDKKIYFPEQIILQRIDYKLFLQNRLLPAFDNGYFEQDKKVPNTYFSDDVWDYRQGISDTISKSSMKSWLSSPEAMRISMELNLSTLGKDDTEDLKENSKNASVNQENSPQTPEDNFTIEKSTYQKSRAYRGKMSLDHVKRNSYLRPIDKLLKQLTYKNDDKFNQLKTIINNDCLNNRKKLIIFVNRLSTAGYLNKGLNHFYKKKLSIGCTVSFDKSFPQLKKGHVRAEELKIFSPGSHNHNTAYEHSILICTDADGVGVNLQDADTLINYDPPTGADALFQRVGRVLRMTADPSRKIKIYTFVPTIIKELKESSQTQQDFCEIFDRLRQRHDKTESILGSRVFSSEKESVIEFDSDSAITEFLRDGELMKDIGGLGAESRLRHISILEANQERAQKVPDISFSAKGYIGSEAKIFVLLRYKEKLHPVIFNISQQCIESLNEVNILDIISCHEFEPCAAVSIQEIDHQANLAAQFWCETTGSLLNETTKVCGLYLSPLNESRKVENIFSVPKKTKS